MSPHSPFTTGSTIGAIAALVIALNTHQVLGVVPGQVDNFQDGTTENWANGGTNAPVISIGGPAGSNDDFLELTADGSGSGGKLTVFNRSQWLGNYVGQGITTISMDLDNFGDTTLEIRLAFKSNTGGGAPGYLTSAVQLPADSGWIHATFSIAITDVTAVGGPAAYNTFFASGGQGEFRIINEAATSNLNGDNVVGDLGIDNIAAVPEPGTVAYLLGAAGMLALRPLSYRFRKRFRTGRAV